MRKTKTINKRDVNAVENSDHDPFLRRIQLQGTVLKKMLVEVGQLSNSAQAIIYLETESPDSLDSENKCDQI